jgi:lipid A 3-O-deacylase
MKFIPALLLICFLGTLNVFSQSHSTEIGLQNDNDSFLLKGSDRYYTDGFFIHYMHALRISGKSALANKVLGFEAGQKIFTPQSGFIPKPQYVDRPFAGYLYIGATLNLLYRNESNLKLGAQIGVVGPASQAEAVQNFVHKTFGFYRPGGWQYQIKNDPEINLSGEYNKLIARVHWIDVSVASYINLGTGFSGAGAGPMVRLGSINQLFHSISTQSTVANAGEPTSINAEEVFFYYKPLVNYVAYDATIQGSLFKKHSPDDLEITQSKEPFVLSQQFGIAFTTKRFVVDAAAIFHTKDVIVMVKRHQWGSITVLYRFK